MRKKGKLPPPDDAEVFKYSLEKYPDRPLPSNEEAARIRTALDDSGPDGVN
jgi:hypothetical protein